MRISIARSKGYLRTALLLVVGFVFLAIYAAKQNSIENRIIRAIDQRCKVQGECVIDLSEITNFKWDTASVFIVSGDWAQIEYTLGIPSNSIEFSDGIVFSYNGAMVKMHASSYYANNDMHPRLSYWIERRPRDPYYRSYSYDDAILHAEKIKLDSGGYRYVLFG